MIPLVCPTCRHIQDGELQTAWLDPSDVCRGCGEQHAFHVRSGALSDDVWAINHWQQPDQLGWLRDTLSTVDDLPLGPVLIIGAAACGEISAVPPARHVVCLEAKRTLLEHAWSLASTDHPQLAAAQLVCGNALDPPFAADTFALILCLNVLDSIADPEMLLGQCEALLMNKGALVLSSPYQFKEEVTAKQRWLDQLLGNPPDLADAVERLVTGAWDHRFMSTMRLQWSARHVPWRVVINDRMNVRYSMHAMLLRRAKS